MLGAVIFDVDGTLAETERDGHRPAFNQAFAEHGLPYWWDVATYGRLLAVTGGRRRIAAYLAEQGHADPDRIAAAVHRTKTSLFVDWVRHGPVTCRPGADRLIDALQARGVRLGVATTGRRDWVLPLLDRLVGPGVFETVVTGDDVERLKPAPDLYLIALRRLGLPPGHVLAVEDSPPGLAAALAAELTCVVVACGYTAGAEFPGAAAVFDGYDRLDVERCVALLRRT